MGCSTAREEIASLTARVSRPYTYTGWVASWVGLTQRYVFSESVTDSNRHLHNVSGQSYMLLLLQNVSVQLCWVDLDLDFSLSYY